MKQFLSTILTGLFLFIAGTVAHATDTLLLKNIGLIVDAPFLHQSERPYNCEFLSPLGDTLITYDYNDEGLPILLSYYDFDSGNLVMDIKPIYASDGRIASITFISYDETDGTRLFVDTFEFSDYLPTGPTSATLVTEENITAGMRLRYDETGRLEELQEDSPFGEGLYRSVRFAWTGEEEASLPYAIEVHYPLDQDVERYYYLYDAEGRLRALDGVRFLETEPYNTSQVSVRYFYETRTFDDIFILIDPDL